MPIFCNMVDKQKKIRLFITGANGFIGTHLITSCRKNSMYAVTAGVGPRWKSGGSGQPDGIQYVKADLAKEDAVPYIMSRVEKCDVIIHLAAHIAMGDDKNLIAANVQGTFNIAQLANAWQVKKVIYLSSIPVTGTPIIHPVDETHPAAPGTLYHASKLSGEYVLQACCAKTAELIILRIPSPLGIGMREQNLLSMLLRKCSRGFLYRKSLYIQRITGKHVHIAHRFPLKNRIDWSGPRRK